MTAEALAVAIRELIGDRPLSFSVCHTVSELRPNRASVEWMLLLFDFLAEREYVLRSPDPLHLLAMACTQLERRVAS